MAHCALKCSQSLKYFNFLQLVFKVTLKVGRVFQRSSVHGCADPQINQHKTSLNMNKKVKVLNKLCCQNNSQDVAFHQFMHVNMRRKEKQAEFE